MGAEPRSPEWPTVALIVACYLIWSLATTWLAGVAPVLSIVATALAIALFSSLQHEVIHGHPFAHQRLNAALVFPGLALIIPYLRFRDTHLDHHQDARLTDPYDDPESNYLDGAVWERLSAPLRAALGVNNTLLGRILFGVAISQVAFMRADWALIRAGERHVLQGWLWHLPAVAIVVGWLMAVGQMPLWHYLLATYLGLSLIKIRTFLEHRAHARASARTVVVEDRGPLAFLFLNNNFHAVHHIHPRVAWYRLPALYFNDRERFLKRNDGYAYPGYGAVFRQYLFRRKDPVAHPLWRRDPS